MGLKEKLESRPVEAAKVVAVWAVAVAFAWLATPSLPSFLAGLGLVLMGLFFRGWAAGHLRRNKQLATSGPYAHLRDPLYLGRLFLLCGFAVMANNRVTYALFGVALGLFFLNYMPRKLRKETARLGNLFGEQYVEYRQQVRSLIPRLRPYPKSSRARWSFAVFWRENREQWLILAVAVLVGLVAGKWWAPWR